MFSAVRKSIIASRFPCTYDGIICWKTATSSILLAARPPTARDRTMNRIQLRNRHHLPSFARTAALVALLVLSSGAWAEPVSFRNDVMAVLSKGGCNQGACHGNQN